MLKLVEQSRHNLLARDGKVLSGLFAEIGTFNQNGRSYPEDIYEQAYEELVPKIGEKRLLGELDHPIDYDEVRLSNVSHVITECNIIEEDGIKKVYGTVELLDTPSGMIAQALVKAGIPIGISSRGVGSTKPVSEGVEVTQLKLITYDLVAEPSFSSAVLSPDKSAELSDSLQYIESNLPLNESLEADSVRGMITRIRESLLSSKTDTTEEIDINKVEIDSLRKLLESTHATIASDTSIMRSSRKQIKSLKKSLDESEQMYDELMYNMSRLQEAYNKLEEKSISREDYNNLEEELIETKKRLAVERRGMSYSKVSDLLEGAKTEEEIENRLYSLNSFGKKRQTNIHIDSILTKDNLNEKKLTGLASIVSRV